MRWDILDFGPYADRRYTMPQLIFRDPGHVCRTVEFAFFEGLLGDEAQMVLERAKRIKIPDNDDGELETEYTLGDSSDFCSIAVVDSRDMALEGRCVRLPVIDLTFAYRLQPYNRAATSKLLRCGIELLFGRRFGCPLAGQLHKFFEDKDNFVGTW